MDRYDQISRIRVRRKRRRQLLGSLVGCGLLVVAGVVLFVVLSPGAIVINGDRVSLRGGATLGDCARAAKIPLETGSLLDVSGAVLTPGGGRAAEAWLDGERVSLDTPVEPGQEFSIVPAADVTEDVKLIAEFLGAPARTVDGEELPKVDSAQFVKSIRREHRGVISGKPSTVEVAYASAVVEPGNGRPRPKCIALTFDDGPNTTWTPQILDVLNSYGARGTFFVLGQAVGPISSVFKRTINEGHEVGTHSWRHSDFTRLSNDAIRSDLNRSVKAMKSQGATGIVWFRPPYGARSSRVDAVVKELGLRIALWDIDTYDWRRPGTDKIVSRVMAGLQDGAVVLMHDGPAHREQTLAAVRRLIPTLQSKGYRFVTMSEARGVKPLFTGDVVLKADGRKFTLTPMARGVTVEVNGLLQELPQPPLQVKELPTGGGVSPEWQILVPARVIAAQMGGSVSYDTTRQCITVSGAGGEATFWLHSTRCDIDGSELHLSVPSVLYGATAYVPLSILKRVCQASAVYDATRKLLLIKTAGSRSPVGV